MSTKTDNFSAGLFHGPFTMKAAALTKSVRVAQKSDAKAVADIYAPAVNGSTISFEFEAPDAAEMGRRIEATLKRWPWLVYESENRILGYAYAGIALPNSPSVALHEALGFRPVGVYRGVGFKLGAWHDVAWGHLALQDPLPDPRPPVDFGALETMK